MKQVREMPSCVVVERVRAHSHTMAEIIAHRTHHGEEALVDPSSTTHSLGDEASALLAEAATVTARVIAHDPDATLTPAQRGFERIILALAGVLMCVILLLSVRIAITVARMTGLRRRRGALPKKVK